MVDRQSGDRYENFQVGGSGLNLIGLFSGVFNYGGNAYVSPPYEFSMH